MRLFYSISPKTAKSKKVGVSVDIDWTRGGGGQNTKAHYLHSVTSRCLSVAIDGKQGVIYEGKPKEGAQAQVTITVDDNDFIDLALGKANAPAVC